MSNHRYHVIGVQPAVGAGTVSPKRPHARNLPGTTGPTVEDVRDELLNRSFDREELDRMGLIWQDERHAIYYAGNETFRVSLEPEQ